MDRDELIKAAVKAGVWANEGELEHDLPILEPLIRADERERVVDDAASVEAVAQRAAEVIHALFRARLLTEAEVARLAPDGKHPDIAVMTHAAALLYAASLIDGGAR